MVELVQNGTYNAAFALGILAVMFALFVSEKWPTEVVALGAAATMLITGVLPYEAALDALSNPAPWTIAAMFIMAGSLVRTGTLDRFSRLAEQWAEMSRARAIAGLLGFAIIASAFVNNAPVVLILIPVIVQLSRKLGVSASKLLIPLSYVSILGGTLTLLGTSTNLLVAGMAQSNGLEAFSIFEVTTLAIILVACGVIYLRFVAPKLLPDRASMASRLSDESKKKFLAEISIPEDNRLIGETATKVELFKRDGVRLVDVLRGDESLSKTSEPLNCRPATGLSSRRRWKSCWACKTTVMSAPLTSSARAGRQLSRF